MSDDVTLKWMPEKLIQMVLDQAEQSAAVVGKFVETEARQRLLSIREPLWGEKYRRQVVSGLLTFEVERGEREVVVNVGVGTSARGRHHGYYIELGSDEYPAQPFLRPAVFQNAGRIVKTFGGGK